MEITVLFENREKQREWMAFECDELMVQPEHLKIGCSEKIDLEVQYKAIKAVSVNGQDDHPIALAVLEKMKEARNEVE